MIIDLQRFIAEERCHWEKLSGILDELQKDPNRRMSLNEVKEFHYLYQRTSADLARITTFSAEPEIRRFLESLTGRAYAEIHEVRTGIHGWSPVKWLFQTFPRTFRFHITAFYLSLAVTLCGMAFGGLAITFDPDSREVLLPFLHLRVDPAKRVATEEKRVDDDMAGTKMTGTAMYITHNTRVSIFTMALGITWGIGTVAMLFYNGVLLGAVTIDYFMAGQAKFLLAWLSPHGVIEIPAVLIAGQAGFVLAGALLGWGRRMSLTERLRKIAPDLIILILGVAFLLCWAGFVEAFISQYHEPVVPYTLKIAFGTAELFLLILFLTASGSKGDSKDAS